MDLLNRFEDSFNIEYDSTMELNMKNITGDLCLISNIEQIMYELCNNFSICLEKKELFQHFLNYTRFLW